TYRALIGFDRTAIAGKHILSATLGLHETYAPSCTGSQLDLFAVASSVPFAPTWANQPTLGARYASTTAAHGASGCPAADVSLSTGGTGTNTLASLVQLWASGTTPVPVVELRAHSESDSNGAKTFTSSEGGSGGPVLHLNYNSVP